MLPPALRSGKKRIELEVYDDPVSYVIYRMVMELNHCYELYVNENSSFPDNPQHLCTSETTKSQSTDTDTDTEQ